MLMKRSTIVKSYKSRGAMQRGIGRMARRGYDVHGHSGDFSGNLFQPVWRRRGVVVTFHRGESGESADVQDPSGE